LSSLSRSSASSKIRIERIDKILPYNKAFDYITKFYTDPAAAKGKKKGNSATDEIDLTGSDDDLPSGEAEGMDELPGGSQANAVVDPIDLASGLPCE
jgi:DNA mismatch repair protein MSH3